jgi:hypothetical protein
MNKNKLHAILSFYSFFIVVDHLGSIGVVEHGKGGYVGGDGDESNTF